MNDNTVIDVYIPVQDFSSALRAMMAIRNINIPVLAEQIGVSVTSVYNWRIGKRLPNKMHIEQLCNVFFHGRVCCRTITRAAKIT